MPFEMPGSWNYGFADAVERVFRSTALHRSLLSELFRDICPFLKYVRAV